MDSLLNELGRLVGKFQSLGESDDPVPGLPRDVPVSEVPAFIQPAIKESHTQYRKGTRDDPYDPTVSYTDPGQTDAIYVNKPKAFIKGGGLAHEATHIYQGTLRHMPERKQKYEYGGWKGLVKARQEGKTINNFTDDQQAWMVMDYANLLRTLRSDAFTKGSPEYQQDMLKELQEANEALGPFIRQLANQPKRSEPEGNRFHPEMMDLKSLNPPAPGPPPASLTGVGVPLPEFGGKSVYTTLPVGTGGK